MKKILFLVLAICFNYVFSQGLSPDIHLKTIFFSDSLRGCAAGEKGTLLYTADGGKKWEKSVGIIPGACYESVSFIDSLNGWAVGTTSNGSSVLKTSDGGRNWTHLSNIPDAETRIYFTDENTGFISGSLPPIIYMTKNGGQSWTVQYKINGSQIGLNTLSFSDKKNGWAAGESNASFCGALFRTTDGGVNWTVVDSSLKYDIKDIKFVSPKTGYCGGIDGTYKTTDGGASWKSVPNIIATNSMSFINEMTGWTCGNFGEISKTTDGGATWHNENPNIQENLNAIFFVNARCGWTVGSLSSVIKATTDGGETWINRSPGYTAPEGKIWDVIYPVGKTGWLSSVFFISKKVGWVSGACRVIKTTDGGISWNLLSNYIATEQLRKIFFADTLNGAAVGEHGSFFRTFDGGQTWSRKARNTSYHISIHRAFFFGLNSAIAVGISAVDGGIIEKTVDGGETWTRIFGLANGSFHGICFVNPDTGFVVGARSSNSSTRALICRTIDGGNNWIVKESGTNEVLSLGSVSSFDGRNAVASWIGGFLLRTNDGGENWTQQELGKSLESVLFTDENNVIALGDYGIILRSTDRGEHWKQQESGTSEALLAAYFTDADNGIIVGGNSVILRKTSGGGTYVNETKPNINPKEFKLEQNYPNPFNPSTTIKFSLPKEGNARLEIFNCLGQKITTLLNEKLNVGVHEAVWNAGGLPSGIYLCRLTSGAAQSTKKLILLK